MKKLILFFLLSSVVSMLSSCVATNDAEPNTSFKLIDSAILQFQDTFFNNEENFQITFDSVLEDSRCPVNAVCKWAGNAKIGFTIANEENKASFTLNTHSGRFPRDTTLLGYKISLLDVMPQPHTDSTFTQNDYSATIVISN